MAIKNVVARGIGFGAVGWVVTRGFGAVTDGAGGGGGLDGLRAALRVFRTIFRTATGFPW